MEHEISKPNSGKPRKKATKRQRAARRANIVAFNRSCGSRQAVTHGVGTVLASKGQELPPVPYADEIRKLVSELIDAAVVDLGGQDAITSMQRQVLESSRLALTIVALGARYLAAEGIVNHRKQPHALLGVLGTYANIIRLNAAELGLDRRAKDVTTLEAKLARIADAEHEKT